MKKRKFSEILNRQWTDGKFVSVGLDSNLTKIPQAARKSTIYQTLLEFNKAIINTTENMVLAYKLNLAFYQAYGDKGLLTLRASINYIKKINPKILNIVDAKNADIGNTNKGYVRALFDFLGADAVTLHPYLGKEALMPFLERKENGFFILCRTSNKGAGEFQDLTVNGGDKLYLYLAKRVAEHWNENGNCALVVGATYPEELGLVRKAVGDIPFLIPGIGKQGGDLEKTVKAGKDSKGTGMVINSSRGIIFASDGPDFAEVARQKTIELHEMINKYR